MKNGCIFSIIALSVQVCSSQGQTVLPAEFDKLRTAYEAARDRAVRPIDEKYLLELAKLQETYTKAAKLEEAVTVANEIKRMKQRLGLPLGPDAPALAPAPTEASASRPGAGGQEQTVTIPANDPNGFRVGGVKRGDTLTLQYVTGKWKDHGGIATENPDDPKSQSDDSRLVIAEAADAAGNPGKVIKIVPPDTVAKVFTYVMQTSRDDVVLRIHTNSNRKENPGSVTYKMKLVR